MKKYNKNNEFDGCSKNVYNYNNENYYHICYFIGNIYHGLLRNYNMNGVFKGYYNMGEKYGNWKINGKNKILLIYYL